MCLLLEAARAWHELENIEYMIDLGRKGTLTKVRLTFNDVDFPHLAGMQYAEGVDFGVRLDEYYGKKLIPSILNRKINACKIETSENWGMISGRLTAIINLQNTLDGNFNIVMFNRFKVKGHSKIDAKFAIKSTITNDTYFVFLDERSGKYYCKSAFRKDTVDYTDNQSSMTVLRKIKYIDDTSYELFRNPKYTPADN